MAVRFPGEEEYDDLIAPVRKLAKFMSIWPLDIEDMGGDIAKYRKARKLQLCHTFFIIFYMLGLLASQVTDAIRKWGAMEEFSACCLSGSSVLLTIIRLSLYANQDKNLLIVLKGMRVDWANASEEDRQILRNKCGPAFKISRYFIICVSVTIGSAMLCPICLVGLNSQVYLLGRKEWILPYGGYFGIDDSTSPGYQVLYCIELIGGIFGISNVASVNCFNVISIVHASTKFRIIQSHLAELRRSDCKSSGEQLRSCIREHQKAIEFANVLEEVINKVALGQFIVSTGLVCFAGLQIAATKRDKIHLTIYPIYLTTAIFELFLFSYSGYTLTTEAWRSIIKSESICDSAFNSDWVGSSFTQNLHIMMMRASKPSKITAAKFYDMSLESFSTVLSTSFSYFTAIRAMQE